MIELTGALWAEGLHFGEGPRWHDNYLYVSDMYGRAVLRFDANGQRETVVAVENRPSGLGWLPDGQLLLVSMLDRKVLRYDGDALHIHADLADSVVYPCNDMVVDATGRAYVGHFGFDIYAGETARMASLIMVNPDGSHCIAADDLLFPNGTVITPDNGTLIVAESFGLRLTAFDIGDRGKLSNRRVWATMPAGAAPDGICLDSAGGIWVASPSTDECLRLTEGGTVTHRVGTDRGAYACMIGDDGHLYILTAASSSPDVDSQETTGQIIRTQAPFGRAGRP